MSIHFVQVSHFFSCAMTFAPSFLLGARCLLFGRDLVNWVLGQLIIPELRSFHCMVIVVLPIASYNRWVLTVILSWLQYVYFVAETWSTGCWGEASVCTMSVATFSLTGQSLTCGRVWPMRLSYIGHKQSSSVYHRGYN